MEDHMNRTAFIALAVMAMAVPALAQHAGHNMGAATPFDLPPVCLANATDGHEMAMPMNGSSTPHPDLMAGMETTNSEMMAGATATDIDVAFVCAMIPHHRGAITMARAELAKGDDPFARQLAEAVIAAQEKEIADMLAWLATQ
jgi:uncharacterized protein (DUF305 family)